MKRKTPELLGLFVSYKENEVLWKQPFLLYSQCFIFFVTYKWTLEAVGFVPGKPFQHNQMWNLSLLGPFICYEDNEVLQIQHKGLYLQHFIFFETYKWTQ